MLKRRSRSLGLPIGPEKMDWSEVAKIGAVATAVVASAVGAASLGSPRKKDGPDDGGDGDGPAEKAPNGSGGRARGEEPEGRTAKAEAREDSGDSATREEATDERNDESSSSGSGAQEQERRPRRWPARTRGSGSVARRKLSRLKKVRRLSSGDRRTRTSEGYRRDGGA